MKPYGKYFVHKAYHSIAEGDWRFQAFFRKAWKKYLENPVNPVKKFFIRSNPFHFIFNRATY